LRKEETPIPAQSLTLCSSVTPVLKVLTSSKAKQPQTKGEMIKPYPVNPVPPVVKGFALPVFKAFDFPVKQGGMTESN
jgi:hypothetical protein